MDNIFKTHMRRHSVFSWGRLGDIRTGRGSMGENMFALNYRLMQHTLLETMVDQIGLVQAKHFFNQAGQLAGDEFAMHQLSLNDNFPAFLNNLVEQYHTMRMGNLKVEQLDETHKEACFSLKSELDCSGANPKDEAVLAYDTGFIAGVLEAYTGNTYIIEQLPHPEEPKICYFKAKPQH